MVFLNENIDEAIFAMSFMFPNNFYYQRFVRDYRNLCSGNLSLLV